MWCSMLKSGDSSQGNVEPLKGFKARCNTITFIILKNTMAAGYVMG